MPLDSPEDYDRLGRHLEAIDAVFQEFLTSSGYKDNTGALGRYPHRSAVLNHRVCRKIDLQMDEDLDGHRFDSFFPDIPYTLWAGAWLDEGNTRYCDGGFTFFERLPFSKVKTMLSEALSQAATRLAVVTESSLKQCGKQSTLRPIS
jgi:hypothetical protein